MGSNTKAEKKMSHKAQDIHGIRLLLNMDCSELNMDDVLFDTMTIGQFVVQHVIRYTKCNNNFFEYKPPRNLIIANNPNPNNSKIF